MGVRAPMGVPARLSGRRHRVRAELCHYIDHNTPKNLNVLRLIPFLRGASFVKIEGKGKKGGVESTTGRTIRTAPVRLDGHVHSAQLTNLIG